MFHAKWPGHNNPDSRNRDLGVDITKKVSSHYPKPDEDSLSEGTKNRLATFVGLSFLLDPNSFQHLWIKAMCEGVLCRTHTHAGPDLRVSGFAGLEFRIVVKSHSQFS